KKQRRAKLGGELLVEQDLAVVALEPGVEDALVDRFVSLAAACRHDHVHGRYESVVALHPGIVQRKASRVSAEALPGFHLALVATLRDLLRSEERRVGSEGE